jgi:hypothetical protein
MNALCPSSYVVAAIFYKSVRYLEPVYMGPKMSDVIESDAMHHPSHTIKKPSDAPEGTRLCKKCAEFLPLERFYPNRTTFECKSHIREHTVLRKKMAMSNPFTKVVINLLDILRSDGKRVFNRDTVGINQADIVELFRTKGVTPTNEWRVVPIHPDETWGAHNIDIVSKHVRTILVSTMSKKCNYESGRYVKTFIALNT